MKKITVVIPTCDNYSRLVECVNSVLSQLHTKDELLVIDNNSKDDTQNYCLDMTERHHNFQYFNTNLPVGIYGKPASRNIAAYYSNNETLLYVDDNEILHHMCVEYHKLLQSSYNIVCGNRYDGPLGREVLSTYFPFHMLNKPNLLFEYGAKFISDSGKALLNEFVKTGDLKQIKQSNFSIKKDVVKNIGGWHEGFVVIDGNSGDEGEFNDELKIKGYLCCYSPFAISYVNKTYGKSIKHINIDCFSISRNIVTKLL